VTERGSICWAGLGEVRGSKPARRRPVLVIQSGPFNASRLNTTHRGRHHV
jgi:mRNA interferase MazF